MRIHIQDSLECPSVANLTFSSPIRVYIKFTLLQCPPLAIHFPAYHILILLPIRNFQHPIQMLPTHQDLPCELFSKLHSSS